MLESEMLDYLSKVLRNLSMIFKNLYSDYRFIESIDEVGPMLQNHSGIWGKNKNVNIVLSWKWLEIKAKMKKNQLIIKSLFSGY